MPSPTTVLNVISTAMRHLGALASGEVPNADEAADGLAAFNDVLETWSLQSLAVYGSDVDTFTTVGGQAIYTMGPTGNWVTQRPVQNISSAYCTINGVDFPIGIWTAVEYDAIPVKAVGSNIIERLAYINDFPNGIVKLYPTPTSAISVSVNSARVLTNATDVGQVLSLPPGYIRALNYAVAVELSSQYGGVVDVSAHARSALAHIKTANRVRPVMSFDPAITGSDGFAYWQRGY